LPGHAIHPQLVSRKNGNLTENVPDYFNSISWVVGEIVIFCRVVFSVGIVVASIAQISEISFPENVYGPFGSLNLNSFWPREPGLSNFIVSATPTSLVPLPEVCQKSEISSDWGFSCKFHRTVPLMVWPGRNASLASAISMFRLSIFVSLLFLKPERARRHNH